MKRFFNVVRIGVLVSFFAVLAHASYSLFALGDLSCAEESGCLEIMQAVLIIMAGLLFLAAAFVKSGLAPAIPFFFFVLCYVFFLREVDFDKMDLGAFADFMLYGAGRYITITLGFAAALIWAFFRFRRYWTASLDFLRSRRGGAMILGGLFLLLGYLFEHEFGLSNAQFFEEASELAGYCLILYAACSTVENAQILPENESRQAQT